MTVSDDFSTTQVADAEHLPANGNFTAVLESPFDRSDLSGDAQNADDGLRERHRREDKKQNRERELCEPQSDRSCGIPHSIAAPRAPVTTRQMLHLVR